MIDHLLGSRASARDVLVDPNYSTDKAVLSSRITGSVNSKYLVGLFRPWHGGSPHVDKLVERLNKRGFTVCDYDLNDHILEPNMDRVLESFSNVQETITKNLEELLKEREFERVHFISMSLGTVAMMLVASRFPRLNGATIVAGSSNLALSTWQGSRTQRLRQELEDQGVDESTLNVAWHDLAPKSHADALKGKSVDMIVSSTDTILPTEYQQELVVALNSVGSQVHPTTTSLGHYMTILSYCWLGNLPKAA